MQTKVTHVFKSLERASISITDFSKLTSISRMSLHRWRNGSAVTDMLRLNLAYSTALRLDRAVAKRKLPLHDRLKAPQRLVVLRKIIASMTV